MGIIYFKSGFRSYKTKRNETTANLITQMYTFGEESQINFFHRLVIAVDWLEWFTNPTKNRNIVVSIMGQNHPYLPRE